MSKLVTVHQTPISSDRLAILSKRYSGLGKNATYTNTLMQTTSVSEIQRYIDALAPLQEKHQIVTYVKGSPEAPLVNPFSPQDVVSYVMSVLMRKASFGIFKSMNADVYCAGYDAQSVIDLVTKMREQYDYNNIHGISNFSGEHTPHPSRIYLSMQKIMASIDVIAESKLRGTAGTFNGTTISIKPSQFGMNVKESELKKIFPDIFENEANQKKALSLARSLLTLNNMIYIAEYARKRGVDVWIDMEDHTSTTFTALIAYPALFAQNNNVGVIFQGNVKRAREDAEITYKLFPNRVHKNRSCRGVYYDKDIPVYHSMEERRGAIYALNDFFLNAPSEYGVKLVLASASMDLEVQKAVVKSFRELNDSRIHLRTQELQGCFNEKHVQLAKEFDIPMDVYLTWGIIFAYAMRRFEKSDIVKGMKEFASLQTMTGKMLLSVPRAAYKMFYGSKGHNDLPELL